MLSNIHLIVKRTRRGRFLFRIAVPVRRRLFIFEEDLEKSREGDAAENADDGRQCQHQADHNAGEIHRAQGIENDWK